MPEVSDLDIYRSANELVKHYGDDAVSVAAQRADALLNAGDVPGYSAWRRIVDAIEELQRKRPGNGERAN